MEVNAILQCIGPTMLTSKQNAESPQKTSPR